MTTTPLNVAPTAGNDSIDGATEDFRLTISVSQLLANDSDGDGGTLSVTSVANGVNCFVSLDGDGNVLFRPKDNFSGLASFSYTISDGSGGKATATAYVDVAAVADAAKLRAYDVYVREDSAVRLNVQAYLQDWDGSESLAVYVSGMPEGARLSAGARGADGVWKLAAADLPDLRITPPANSDADFELTVRAVSTESSNGSAESVETTLRVTVAAQADVPVLAVTGATGFARSAIALDIRAALADTDGSESLQIQISGVPPGAVLSAGTRDEYGLWTLTRDDLAGLTLTPASDQDLQLKVVAIATEGENGSRAYVSQTLHVTVHPGNANQAPVAADDANAGDEDAGTLAGNVLANDADAEAGGLAVSGPGTIAGTYGSLRLDADGSYAYTLNDLDALAEGQTVSDVFSYRAQDPQGALSAPALLTITITGTNDTPTVSAVNAAAVEDGAPVTMPFAAADVDSPALTYAVSSPEAGAVTVNGDGTFTFDPGAGFQHLGEGETHDVSFTYTAADGQATSAPVTVTVTIAGSNDAPLVLDEGLGGSVSEDGVLVASGTLGATDVDGPQLHWSGSATGTYGTLSVAANGQWTYTLDNGAAGVQALSTGQRVVDAFDVSVSDGFASAAASVQIDIAGANEPALFDGNANTVSFNNVVAGSYLAGTQYDALAGNDVVTLPSSAAEASEAGFVPGTAFNGGGGNDSITGGALADAVNGGSGVDTLLGGGGDDTLNGGTGIDSMTGGAGDDLYRVDGIGTFTDSVVESLNGGTDTVESSVNYSLGANVEHLVLTDSASAINGTGNTAANAITGTSGANTLSGLAGNDTLAGGGGNDRLDGGAGNDSMAGGTGNDTYVVDATGDTVLESADEGTDTVESAVTYSLDTDGANVERLTLTGTAAINGTGNGLANTITGNAAANVLDGLGGNDSLSGGAGNDTLNGAAGNDTLDGGDGDDSIDGGDGDDWVEGGAGDNTLVGGAGIDTLSYAAATDWVWVWFGPWTVDSPGAGNDVISEFENFVGSRYDDVLIASDGADDLVPHRVPGGDGNDQVGGGAGSDTLEGGNGDDLINGGAGNDSLDGGDGSDTIWFSGDTPVSVNLAAQSAAGAAGVDSLRGIENVIGSNGNDVLIGASGIVNVIEGDFGNDTLTGQLEDTVSYAGLLFFSTLPDLPGVEVDLAAGTAEGGAGNDVLSGFGRVLGSERSDTIAGSSRNEVLAGGDGNDRLSGLGGGDTLEGGSGNDTLLGGTGVDTASYASATGAVTVNLGSDSAAGAAGVDSLSDIEVVVGSDYDDTLHGSLGVDRLDGGDGDDWIDGGGGSGDSLLGGRGDDTIDGGGGSDTIQGGEGTDVASFDSAEEGVIANLATGRAAAGVFTDVLIGFEGLWGSDHDDQLFGDGGDNLISGGDGNDTLRGGNGDDTLLGGDGSDAVTYATASGAVSVDLATRSATGAAGNDSITGMQHVIGSDYDDTLTGTSGANSLHGGLGDDTIDGGDGDDTLRGGDGSNTVSYASATGAVSVSLEAQSATGAAGNDSIAGMQHVVGSDYDDTLTGSSGANHLDGGRGSDTVSYAPAAGAVMVNLATGSVTGAAGNDSVTSIENAIGTAYDDTLTGSSGANTLDGGLGDDSIDGGEGNDTLSYASAPGAVTVNLATASATGASGNDSITDIENVVGSDYDDTLTGSSGDDTINGGAGDDTINGGTGNDTATYADAAGGVFLRLDTSSASGAAGIDRLSGIENLVGSAYDDQVTGNGFANRLEGGTGNDQLRGRQGADTLDGGDGEDTADYFESASGVTVSLVSRSASGGAGDDVLISIEHINGSNSADTLTGNAQANRIVANSGNDSIDARAGYDTLEGGTGNDTLDGGDGQDTADYSASASGVTASLASGTASGGAGNDMLVSIEHIEGSIFADSLTGDGEANRIAADAGDDAVEGGSGDDTLEGGGNDDTLEGGAGDDTLAGDDGDDWLWGGAGADTLTGGSNADTYVFDTLDGSVDLITTYSSVDQLAFSGPAFAALGVEVTASEFRFGAGAISALTDAHNLIYNTATGDLYYDHDGVGGDAGRRIAILDNAPALDLNDFAVI